MPTYQAVFAQRLMVRQTPTCVTARPSSTATRTALPRLGRAKKSRNSALENLIAGMQEEISRYGRLALTG